MNKNAIKPVTLILVGNVLTIFNSIGNGWATSVVAIIGFVLFFIGLGQFKNELDEAGKSAVKLLVVAAIIGIVGLLIDFIPLVGIVASLVYLAAYIVELVAFIKLKGSDSIGETGAKGAQLLLIAMIITLVGVLFGILPLVGGIITKLVSIAAFLLVLFGWLKVQDGVIEKV